MQMSTTHSSFDRYCISHKTISYRAAAAPGLEVNRECPMTQFPALPLLATNPGDATVCSMLSPSSVYRGTVHEVYFGLSHPETDSEESKLHNLCYFLSVYFINFYTLVFNSLLIAFNFYNVRQD